MTIVVPMKYDSETGAARYIEKILGGYLIFWAALCFLLPEAFDHPVYAEFHSAGIMFYGGVATGLAFFHYAALWYNGRNPYLSRILRAVACYGHLCFTLVLGAAFVRVGALLPLGLYWGVLPLLILFVSQRIVGQIKYVRSVKGLAKNGYQ